MAGLTDLSGRTCIVTGASNGIGKVTAAALAGMGARTVMVCRDPARGEAARAEIAQRSANSEVDLLIADVSSQRQVRRLAADINERYNRLDVLVNNAGAMNTVRTLTEDGIETTFAVNHLAYFLLTDLLLDMLKAGDGGRVVNVSSRAHVGSRINFDDIGGEQRYSGYRIYGQSKLANVLFTYELARRLDGSGVSANCLHPGVVATGFGHNNSDLLGRTFSVVLSAIRPFIMSPERGAETSIYLASSPEVAGASGKYFSSKKAIKSSPETYDDAAAQRLWRLSEDLTQPSAAT
jgi:NAD(P)-dependent dehydrogenase (short-subunit alcohol dehydrogenase family)